MFVVQIVYHSLLNFSKNILAFRVNLEHTNSTTNNPVIIPDEPSIYILISKTKLKSARIILPYKLKIIIQIGNKTTSNNISIYLLFQWFNTRGLLR